MTKPNPQPQFSISIFTHAPDPNIALSALDDIVHITDNAVEEFSSIGHMQPEDIPLIIDGASNFENESYHYHMTISNTTANTPEPNLPQSILGVGDFLYHVDTGVQFRIRARVYYHIARRWYFVCVNVDDPEDIRQLPREDLITARDWNLQLAKLNQYTEKTWLWHQGMQMFNCVQNKARRLRLSDVRNVIAGYENNEEVPF